MVAMNMMVDMYDSDVLKFMYTSPRSTYQSNWAYNNLGYINTITVYEYPIHFVDLW